VLLSGNHAEVARWRCRESLRRTLSRRPDLIDRYPLTEAEMAMLAELDRTG
jgi:tRNA (guanine37-N1)-methyltransferase